MEGSNDTTSFIFQLDDLRIDPERREVERAGVALDVAGLSFQLLRYLLEHGNRVIGFDELIERVWAPAVVNEETVTQRVKLLRQALGDDGRNPRYIRSVRGRGYQLCGVPRRVAREVAAPSPVQKRTGSHWRMAVMAATAAVALAALAWSLSPRYAPPKTPLSTQDELLQRARYYADIGQGENNERAVALYEQVLHADAGNMAAQVGLSRALSARICLYNGDPESAARAQSLAQAVIARAPKDSAAHAALAYSFDCRGDIDAAIREYDGAIALDPSARDDSRASRANLYVTKGRLAEALRENIAVEKTGAKLRFLDLQIARNLELLGFVAEAEQRYAKVFRLYPDNVFSNVAYPRALFVQGRFTEAESAVGEALQRPLHPALLQLAGELALVRGDRARALEMFAKASALRPHQSLPATLQHVYAIPPDNNWIAARSEVRAAEAETGEPDDWLEVAQLRLAGNDHAGAITALRRAVTAGFRDRAWLQTSPLLRPLSNEPAFADVINAISHAMAQERAQVLAADWLPADLVNAKPAVPSG